MRGIGLAGLSALRWEDPLRNEETPRASQLTSLQSAKTMVWIDISPCSQSNFDRIRHGNLVIFSVVARV